MPLFALLSIVFLVSGCPQPYDPCFAQDDCEPDFICVGSGASRFCSLECQEDVECPPGVTGKPAACSLQLGAPVCVP